MTMISVNEFKNGLTIQYNNDLWRIVEFQHVKPGKGSAFVRSKLKSLTSGAVQEYTFRSTAKVETADIETKEMQYLYNDGTLYYFMDNETFEQVPLEKDIVEEALNFMRENDMAQINFHQGKAFRVSPANFVELEVTQTEPGVKGDTSSGGSKPATVETGFTLNVPLFVNTGDIIRIDTRSGEYMSRA